MSDSQEPGTPFSSSLPPPPPADLTPPPPSYGAYGRPGAGREPFRRVRALAKAIVVLQIVSIACSAVVLALQVAVKDDADAYRAHQLTPEVFRHRLTPYFTAQLLLGTVGAATIVLLIVWTYRMAANLDVLGRQPHTWRRGWGIGVWLLQGCTFSILPYLMLRELWRGSDPEVAPGDPTWKQRPISPLLQAWFAVNLAQLVAAAGSGTFAVGSFSVGRATDKIAEATGDRLPFIVSAAVLGAASTILLIAVVGQLTARHAAATGDT